MARISKYKHDENIAKDDFLLGTDFSSKQTRNFSFENITDFLAKQQEILGSKFSYTYKNTTDYTTLQAGQLTFNSPANTVNFSAVTDIYIYKLNADSVDIEAYLTEIKNSNSGIAVFNNEETTSFGVYKITSISTQITNVLRLQVQELTKNGTVTKDNPVHVGIIPATDTSGGLDFVDNDKARFGTGGDLEIYHADTYGSDQSWIRDVGTNDLILDTNGSQIALISDGVVNDGKMALFKKDGAVELYYDNNKKFETTNTGVTITGKISGITDPSAAQDAATKAYVDDKIQTLEEVEDIVGNMVSSNTESGISVTYDDTGGKLNFNVTNTQLTTEEVQDIVGGMVSGNTETNISVTYDDTSGKLNFVSTDTDTNTQLSTEEVQDIIGGMVSGNTETNISVTYDDTNGKLDFVSTDTNTQLTTEEVQDIVGAMFSGNTETRIGVTYDDSDGTIDLVVDDMTADTNTQLSNEQVQDIVGAMFTGNTETNISATYQDGDGTIDLVATGTTYGISAVDGDNTDEEKIRLTDGDGTTDDVVLEAGTGLSIARSSDKITFTNTVTDTNTQNVFASSFVDSSDDIILRLTKSGASSGTQDITINAGSNITLTHTDANNITIASADTNTQLSQEQVEDFVGGMLDGTETGISVSYDDTDGNIDFVVSDTTVAGDSGSTGITPGDTLTIAGGANVTTAMSGDTLTITSTDTNTQLSTEQVQDIVGAMFSGNTETRIAATYQDGDGTIDLVVDDMTANTDVDVSNANLLTRLAALESSGGAANENIVIGTDVDDTIVITGNLQVSGTTTTVNSTTVNLNDHNIVLDSGNTTSAVVNGAGITLEGGTGDDATFTYSTTGPQFEMKLGSAYEDLQIAGLKTSGIVASGDVTIDAGASSTLNIYKDDAGNGKLSFYNDSTQQVFLLHDTADNFYIHAGSGSAMIISTNGATTLTLDTSNNATFAASIIANDTSKIEKAQITTQFDTSSFLRLHPSATTNSGGYTNMIFGTDTANNYGVAIGGKREGTDGTPTFSIRMLNDSITGTEVLNISNSGDATFAGNVDVNGTEITVGTNNSIFAENNIRFKSSGAAYIDHNTTGQSIIFRTSTSSSLDTTALTITNAGNATFAGSVTANSLTIDDITIDGSTISDSSALTISSGDDITIDADSDINLDANGADIRFKDNGTNFVEFNSSTGTTFAGNISVTGTTFLDGDVTVGDTSSAFIGLARAGLNYIAATNASGQLVFRTGGTTAALTLDASQNATFAGNVTVQGTFTSIGIDDNADAIAITINGNEEVGIGTTSPFYKLDVNGTFRASGNATFSGDVQADNIGLGAAATSFGTGVPTLLFKGTNATNGRAGALYFKENDGTDTAALYVTDGNDGYGTVLTAYQGSLKLATGSLTGTVLTLDQSNNATFAGVVKGNSYFSAESTGGAYIRFKHSTGGLNYVGSSESLASGFGDENDMLNYSVSGKWGVYTNSAFAMVIDESQNVGIGTTTPQTTLEVDGASSAFNAHFGQGTDNQSGVFGGISLGYSEANTSYRKVGIVAKALADGAARQNLHFLVDTVSDAGSAGLADTKMMIDGLTGYVGIGTTSPSKTLHVVGDQLIFGNLFLQSNANGFRTIALNTTDGADNQELYLCGGATASSTRGAQVGVYGNEVSTTGGSVVIVAGNVSTGDIDFLTANTQRMIINNAGNVGIGTTTPQKALHIEGASGASASQLLVCGPSDTIGDTAGILLRAEGGEGDSALRAKGGIFFEREAANGLGKLHLCNNNSNNNDSADLSDAVLTILQNGQTSFVKSDNTSTPAGSINHASNDFLYVTGGTGGASFGDDSHATRMIIYDNDYVRFDTGSSERMRIDSSGDLTMQGGRIYVKESDLGNTAIALTRDADEGYVQLFSSGTQTIEIRGNGNSYFNSGNIGIGTTSPTEKLRVQGDSGSDLLVRFQPFTNNAQTKLYLSSVSSGDGGYFYNSNDNTSGLFAYGDYTFYVGTSNISGSIGNARMIIKQDGKVGIGTTSPSQLLQVNGNGLITKLGVKAFNAGFDLYNDGTTYLNGATTIDADLTISESNGEINFSSGNGVIQTTTASTSLTFGVNGSEKMRIHSTGDVMIGGTNPTIYNSNADDLIIYEANDFSGITLAADSDEGSNIYFADADDDNVGGITYNHTSNYMMFRANGAERIRITSDGDIGIGSTSPSSYNSRGQDLVIKKTGSDVGISIVAEASGGTDYSSSIMFADGTGGTAGYRGVIEYDHADDSMAFNTAATVHAKINSSGALTMLGDVVAFGSPSDKRLKENIKPIESALDKVSKLQGVTFDWKPSDSILEIKEDVGFIAQDVQKVMPELVRENKDGMLSMRHQGVAPILLEAIKELKAEIEELKKQIK